MPGVHLAQRAWQVTAQHPVDVAAEGGDVGPRVRRTDPVEQPRHRLGVLERHRDDEDDQLLAHLPGQPAHQAEVDERRCPHREAGGSSPGAGRRGTARPRRAGGTRVSSTVCASSVRRSATELGLEQPHPVEVLERQHRRAAELLVDPRDADALALPVSLLEGAHVLRLVHEVELLVDRPVELLDDAHRRVDAGLLHHRLEQPRQRPAGRGGPTRSAPGCRAAAPSPPPARRRGSAARCTWAMLAAASGCGSMLAKASSGERPRPAWICRAHRLERDGGHRVLEEPELVDELAGKQVGARGEHLPELHERRAQVLEHPPEAARCALRARVSGACSTGSRRPMSRNTPARSSRSANPCRAAMVAICRSRLRSWRFKGSAQGATDRNPPGVVGQTLER